MSTEQTTTRTEPRVMLALIALHTDLPVPGQPYSFGTLQAAQAAGDRQALAQRGRPLLHVHLTDRAAGVARLVAAARSLAEEV